MILVLSDQLYALAESTSDRIQRKISQKSKKHPPTCVTVDSCAQI